LAVSRLEVDMPFRYSVEFRRQVVDRMLAGEAVQQLAADLSVSDATLYKWRRQALVDAGESPGLKSYEADRLAQARRRIKHLEDELKLVRAASALFNEIEVISPKGSTRLSER
jgi:transposase-like protein